MPEEVLFESEERMSRDAVAKHLRSVADKLEGGGQLTLSGGGEDLGLEVPANPTFEVKAERETSSGGGPAELSVEFELEWTEGEGDDEQGGFSVE